MEKKVRMSEKWQEKLKEFEGLRLVAYRCPGGFATIGYGHLMKPSEKMKITKSEAEALLLEDIAKAEKVVSEFEKEVGTLSAGQWDSLTSFVFNIGGTRFLRSTLANKIRENKNSVDIGRCFDMWCYANNKKLIGLVKRRNEEKKRYYEK